MSSVPAWSANDLQIQRFKVLGAGICALVLSVGLARFAYTPMLPIMRNQAGMSDVVGGWLASFNYLGYIAGALVAAMLGDLRRKFLLYRAGLVIAIVSTFGMGLTSDPHWWAALRFTAGFSSTAGLLLASGLVLNWLIRQRYKPVLGLHFTGLGLGVAVSGLAVAAMAGHGTWRELWLGLGLLGLVFCLPAWGWLPAPAALPAGAAGEHGNTLARRAWWLLIGAYFCAGFGYVVSATFIVAILDRLPVLQGQGPWIWVLVGAAAVPSSFVWDRVAAGIGQVRALMLAYGLQIVSIVLPALSSGTALNLLSAVLFGATFVGIVSLTLALIGRRSPHNPAKAMARLTLSYGAAQIIAPAMTGYLVTATGNYRGALWITAAVMTLGVGLLWAFMRCDAAPATSAGQRGN